MSRFWQEGIRITVTVNVAGIPEAFVWLDETHSVEGISDNWRIDEGWWVSRKWRHYFRLSTTTGLLVDVYHDLHTGHWYLERLYD